MSADPRVLQLEHDIRSGDPRSAAGRRATDDDDPAAPWFAVLAAWARLDGANSGEARSEAEAAWIDARRHGNPDLTGVAARVVGAVRLTALDADGARAALAEAAEQLHRTRDRTRLADLALDRARLAAHEGDPATAETRVADAVAAYDGLGERRAAARALLLGARLRRDQGDTRGAVEVLAGVLRRIELDDPLCAGAVDVAFAEQELAEGAAPEALRLARRALGRLAHGWLRTRVEAWEVVGLAHRALGDTDAAMVSLRRAAELLDEDGWPSDRPRIRAAHLQLQDGRYDAARASLQALLARIPSDADPTRAAIAHAMSLPPAVDARDWTGFAHHLRRAATLADTSGPCHPFAAYAARQAGAMCDAIGERGSGPVARGVRAHSLAVNLFGRAPGHAHEVAHDTRALAELRGRATPGPAERRDPRADDRRGPIPAGPFDLLRPVGRGATGEVWRGRHHDRRWPVAVKVLAPGLGDDPRFRLLLTDEIRAMAALDHPNVVRVLGTGHLGPEAEVLEPTTLRAGAPWFAMELAEAGTLEPLCGALPWTQCRAVMLALLDALAHAHARGVVHLDLKPANVLLRTLPDGRRSVLLTDFGLAGLLARAGGARIAGTPQYMAPEQFRGERRDLGPWTDLYAFGCLAYQLLSGAPPFSGDLDVLRSQHLEGKVPRLTARVSVPTGIEAWIDRLLHKSPADRYQRAADAAWGLQRLPDRFESLRLELDPADVPLAVATVVLSIESAPADPRGTLLRLDGTGMLDAPPTPEEWRPLSPLRLDVDLAEAALALFSLRRPPLVGREAERDRMWAVLRDVIETGVPRVVRVEGPSGSGKTALAQWLAERAHELGVATVLDGTPGADGQLGIRALVLRHLRLDGLDEPAALERVGALVPTLPTSVRADLAAIAADRGVGLPLAEQVGAVAAMVGATATARPVVVRLAAGPGHEEGVLAQVLARVPAPVLVVLEGAADVGDVDLVRITLGPMSDRDLAALLDARIPLASSLRARTIELAGGNPDLAVQLVADRIAADALVPVDGGYELAPGSGLVLPQRVVRTYAERLGAVLASASTPERTTLCAAALLGADATAFRWGRLCEVGGVDPEGLVARADGLVERTDGGPRFAHPAVPLILREAWADLAAAEVALAALDPACPASIRWPVLLRAGRWAEAVEPLGEAARDAFDRGDADRATECLDRRAEVRRTLGGADDAPEQVDDALLRARIAHVAARPAGALAGRAAELATRHGVWPAAGEAELLAADAAGDHGDLGGARAALRRAKAAFERAGDPDGAARAQIRDADLLRVAGELDAAADGYRAAAASRSAVVRAEAAVGSARTALARGRVNEAETELLSAMHAARSAGAPRVECDLLAALGDASRLGGRTAASDARYRAALALVPWHDVRRTRELGLRRAILRLAGGRTGEAAGQIDALPQGTPGSTFEATRTLVGLALAVRRDDRTWASALSAAERALGRIRDADAPWLLELAGRRAVDAGRTERAQVVWRLATAAYRRLGRPTDAGRVERAADTLTRSNLG